jgi:uncharacterized protein YbaR (Trm112 family)
MLTPLVDLLRCPTLHDETWLVASIARAENRDIVEGTLGCPICHAEYLIREGVVEFDASMTRAPFAPGSEFEATRLAAALELTEARTVAALHGGWGAHAPIVAGLTPSQLLLVNPPAGIVSGDGISIVQSATAPFAALSVDALAIDDSADVAMRESLLRALRAGGRMLAPVTIPLPPDFTELARDDQVWVAVRDRASVTSAPIMPKRRSRTTNQ